MKTNIHENGSVLPVFFFQLFYLLFIFQHRTQFKIGYLEGYTIKSFFSPLTNSTF